VNSDCLHSFPLLHLEDHPLRHHRIAPHQPSLGLVDLRTDSRIHLHRDVALVGDRTVDIDSIFRRDDEESLGRVEDLDLLVVVLDCLELHLALSL
jgi:hypothetical protein